MAKNQQMVRIDAEKLQAELVKRGLDRLEVSKSIGMSKYYLTNAMNGNSWQDKTPKIGKGVSIALKALYNIDEESYKYVELADSVAGKTIYEKQNENTEVNELFVSQLTGEELSNLIYKAVFSAVKHAWEDTEN